MTGWLRRHRETIIIVAGVVATYGFVAYLAWVALGMPFYKS